MNTLWFLFIIIVGSNGIIDPTLGTPLASATSLENCEYSGEILSQQLSDISKEAGNDYQIFYICAELNAEVENSIL